MKSFKKFIYFPFLTIFIVSCDPESLPGETEMEIPIHSDFYSDTGEQKDVPPTKDDDN